MRLIAKVSGHPSVKRLMIHECDDGVYLFTYELEEDGGASGDLWFESVADAKDVAAEDYGVTPDRWSRIPDPLPHCQQDWIKPARIPGRENGDPQWGRLEVLEDGVWVEVPM